MQRGVAAYDKISLSFETNVGQADSEVRFLSRGPGYTLFLTSSEAMLVAGKDQFQVRFHAVYLAWTWCITEDYSVLRRNVLAFCDLHICFG
jgi:hypothetical protein